MKLRILIVEDEPGIADTLQYALRTEGFEPVWVATGAEALAQVAAQPPALILLDVGLPDTSGFEVFKQVRARADVPVVFLTARSDEIDRVLGLELGADDYMAKPFSPRELVARVRALLRRAAMAPPPAAAAAPSRFELDDAGQRIRYAGQWLNLTRLEHGLLRTLLAAPTRIHSRDALLAAVWGDAVDATDRTVDTHVKTLRAKLRAVRPGHDPIATHRGLGYGLADDAER